jgi:hypothetical protein
MGTGRTKMQVKWFAAGIAFAAVSAGAPAPAAADTRVGVGVYVGDHPRPRHNSYDTRRLGYERGYRDGLHEGDSDGRHHRRPEYWREGRYRSGTSGYERHYGPKHVYADGYRGGYEDGYRRGYSAGRRYDRRDDRWDGGWHSWDDRGRTIYELPPRW